ncbi:hypothetical protein [uncultured Croceitalea sp.]|uniref:hypothetical protein n=1 Tax=uncultured Croceitalea sp. TaxID=1798908 RepID=UPI0033066C56
MKRHIVLMALLVSCTVAVSAQALTASSTEIHVDDLPEYIIISSEARGISGGILPVIESKGSVHDVALTELESMFADRKKLNLKNQIDLLNKMSELGYEFVNAYPSWISNSTSRVRTGMVFRKKPRFRD